MDNKKNSKPTPEFDFLSDSLFKRSIKKTKWKQFGIYTLISIITLVVCIFIIHNGARYLINKKMDEDHQVGQRIASGKPIKGAGFSNRNTRYSYNLFSAVGETTIYKRIGNRQFVWDIIKKEYPAIGKVNVIDRKSGMTEVNHVDKEAKRLIRYNQLNNEKIIQFYYPSIKYTYLPHELDIATGLDKNTLIEVALSFNEPMTPSDLGKVLGFKNVDWLWVNLKSAKQMDNIPHSDLLNVQNGDSAYGYGVSEEYPYTDGFKDNTKISGAVVSGTPQELKRFLSMDIIRASVIGVTIDKY